MTEYKRLGDYIREVIISNREHGGDASLYLRRWKKTEGSTKGQESKKLNKNIKNEI